MSATILSLRDVVKSYGTGHATIEAVRGVSFDVPEGQFVSIVGPSGCGKSTLLNLMAVLDEPTSGTVTVDGRDVASLSVDERCDLRLRRIGFVFQSWNLLPTFTALENVVLPLEFQGVRWREARARATGMLDAVRVPTTAHARRPAEMSGGEQQRTAVARALVTAPGILLADEPTGNLDSHTGEALLDLLVELNAHRHLTIVMVTHSTFAAGYGHRIIELGDGRIIRDVLGSSRADLHQVREPERV